MSFPAILAAAAAAYGITLTEEHITAFSIYNKLLVEWNEKVNLTALTAPQDVAVKHIIDSLSCYDRDFFPQDCTLIDVGTGAGFPGVPLKILRPDIKLTLLDSLNKRVLFLKELALQLNLQATEIIHARAEEGARQKQHRMKYQVAVSRAVARLNILAELCLPFVQTGGYFIALKGAQYREEVQEATAAINLLGGRVEQVRPVVLPGFADTRAVIYIKKVAHTPDNYPRRPGIPEKKPL